MTVEIENQESQVEQTAIAAGKIKCEQCGTYTHAIALHLKDHADPMTLDEYKALYPSAPLLSEKAREQVEKKMAEKAMERSMRVELKSVVDLFGVKEADFTNTLGKVIAMTCLQDNVKGQELVPEKNPAYVFNPKVLRSLIMATEMNIPAFVWGHAGTGKTTIITQIAAATNRPMMRVQHTVNTEEDQIVGTWVLRDGSTRFELGPLAVAMKYGWMYVADEYDFGRPDVLAVYQAVLEGAPLVIKQADEANRVVRPHPNFRFFATGNTNGGGDESGLYSGTSVQNSANFERFGIVINMPYMSESDEIAMLTKRMNIPKSDAKKLVQFATICRDDFGKGKISSPLSPRSLLYAVQLGASSCSYENGLHLAYVNRLPSAERHVVGELVQRHFGS